MKTIEKTALDSSNAVDLLPGEAAESSNGLTRRVFGALVGAGTAGILGSWALITAGGEQDWVPTSFGGVRIAAAERQARLGGRDTPATHSTHGAAAGGTQPANHTWGDHLVVKLEVRNESDRDVLFAPGQLRLRIGVNGPSVTNRGADVAKEILAAGSRRAYWISYLVPTGEADMKTEFTDPWGRSRAPLALALPSVVNRPGSMEAGHE
ncbi:hypothetical protein [Arthrobacter sp. H5]|uniref:hypothetical protein n=1 Tax=Arthrobacter sp. H5 TaxID=1267973 RepID=UPI0004B16F8B|nr:hypothetical protein [Arthrobacter sp. H5]